jgi:hypothetical protein
MSEPTPDPDTWGADPLSEEISSQIACMPDRPRVVIALINGVDEHDPKIMKAMSPHREAFLTVTPIKVFHIPYRIYYFGFDPDTEVTLADFLATLGAVPFMEGAIYVEGAPAIRLSKVKLAK